MRLALELTTINGNKIGPNYHHPFGATITHLLRFESNEFKAFAEEQGFMHYSSGFRHFTFALRFRNFDVDGGNLLLLDHSAILLISAPKINEFVEGMLLDLLPGYKFSIIADKVPTLFQITKAELLEEPVITPRIKCRLLSPLVLSELMNINGKPAPYFYRYSDPPEKINHAITMDLLDKYSLIYGKNFNGEGVKLSWDRDYIDRRLEAGRNITQKVSVPYNELHRGNILGNLIPFTITGPVDLIELGYQAGFGEYNSDGFGYADLEMAWEDPPR